MTWDSEVESDGSSTIVSTVAKDLSSRLNRISLGDRVQLSLDFHWILVNAIKTAKDRSLRVQTDTADLDVRSVDAKEMAVSKIVRIGTNNVLPKSRKIPLKKIKPEAIWTSYEYQLWRYDLMTQAVVSCSSHDRCVINLSMITAWGGESEPQIRGRIRLIDMIQEWCSGQHNRAWTRHCRDVQSSGVIFPVWMQEQKGRVHAVSQCEWQNEVADVDTFRAWRSISSGHVVCANVGVQHIGSHAFNHIVHSWQVCCPLDGGKCSYTPTELRSSNKVSCYFVASPYLLKPVYDLARAILSSVDQKFVFSYRPDMLGLLPRFIWQIRHLDTSDWPTMHRRRGKKWCMHWSRWPNGN